MKTSNLMLDGNFNPRLGDFGLERLMDHDKNPVSTITVGTMGTLLLSIFSLGTKLRKPIFLGMMLLFLKWLVVGGQLRGK